MMKEAVIVVDMLNDFDMENWHAKEAMPSSRI